MSWVVYILECRDGSLYTGVTTNLDRRLKAHATGRGSRYVRSRLPFRLVYSEKSRGRSEALKKEARLKRLPRGEKIKRITGN